MWTSATLLLVSCLEAWCQLLRRTTEEMRDEGTLSFHHEQRLTHRSEKPSIPSRQAISDLVISACTIEEPHQGLMLW